MRLIRSEDHPEACDYVFCFWSEFSRKPCNIGLREFALSRVLMKGTAYPRDSDPTGITFNGCEEAKRRIAEALAVEPSTTDLSLHKLDLANWAFQCSGSSPRGRFFARVYLQDFNRRCAAFPVM